MDKRILQTYSSWAKENLEKQIEISLKSLGINSETDIANAKRAGDYTVIEGNNNSYPADLLDKRSRIISHIQLNGYKSVIEEYAYTWFNRFVALRFMEVHDFFPHGFRVLSNLSGDIEPEILKNIALVKDDLNLNLDYCATLKEQNGIEELFRYVLIKQCAALADTIPMLFANDLYFLELLLPKTLLKGDTVITRLIDIPEEYFLEDVDVIGWMYQFYISSKKDEVNRDKKTITKDTLPAVTQLFTPEWIVRYMAENSVGRLWMESYPDSELKKYMQYFVSEAEQDEEVQKEIDSNRYKNINPEDIRIIEPCCGSGHILIYVFDLLYKMYEEKGYQSRDIPTLILSKNITGLDIDKRASQLASFSLLMKARKTNNRFFRKEYYCVPQVYEIKDSRILELLECRRHIQELKVLSDVEYRCFVDFIDRFENAKTIGSLLKLHDLNLDVLEQSIIKIESEGIRTIFNAEFFEKGIGLIRDLLVLARVMNHKYDVMITNPPYIGTSSMEGNVIDYALEHYPDSKTDLFAMFMETGFIKENGFLSMVNMHSWMFISSYENLRPKITKSMSFITMAHLGARAFDEIGGEVVQTTAFVGRKQPTSHYKGVFARLVGVSGENNKRQLFLSGDERYIFDQYVFSVIPGNPFAYWVSENFINDFNNKTIDDYVESKAGVVTGKDPYFVRFWFEPKISDIMFSGIPVDYPKYALMQKGGSFRRYYGNNWYVLKLKDMYDETKVNKSVRRGDPDYYFKKGIGWSQIGTGEQKSFRIIENSVCGTATPTIYVKNDEYFYYLLALLNSKVSEIIFSITNPTMNLLTTNICAMPVIESDEMLRISDIVKRNIEICKKDWDSSEISWDFKKHPLIPTNVESDDVLLESLYSSWDIECQLRFSELKRNEETINEFFINLYGLNDEMSASIKDEDVTVRLADRNTDVKSLISYFIGLIFGRYSLKIDGVVYAGDNWNLTNYEKLIPDDDGIIPVYRGIGMSDGLTAVIINLLKLIYGETTYKQNIDFIAESLGKKTNESSEETLNRYLNDGFYHDHLKKYQKHPIYWLFSSGKNDGFKCLIYMHRYNEDTLARINAKYFLPESTRIKNELEEINLKIRSSEGKAKLDAEKNRQKLFEKYGEVIEYGQVLDHLANRYINIDLDDGVKTNYALFQGVELITDSGNTVKKDLLSKL